MHLSTAERLALRLAPSNVPRDEARAAAPEALLRALRTFDGERGAAFPTHLCWCVRSAVRDLGRLYGGGDDELDDADAGPAFDPRQSADLDLDALSSDLRLIALDLAEGWSPEESAERRGLSVHQVRRARTRVREALRS
jgi:DNA-directed RNA polymerase specialized sigma24 family protein